MNFFYKIVCLYLTHGHWHPWLVALGLFHTKLFWSWREKSFRNCSFHTGRFYSCRDTFRGTHSVRCHLELAWRCHALLHCVYWIYRDGVDKRSVLTGYIPLMKKRHEISLFHTLFKELRENKIKFFNYFRMSISSFDELNLLDKRN